MFWYFFKENNLLNFTWYLKIKYMDDAQNTLWKITFCRDKPNTLKIRSVLWFYRFSWGISIFDELQRHQIKVWKISRDWLPNNYHVSNAIIPVSKMPARSLTGQTGSNKLPWQLRGILISFEIFQPLFSEESTWVEVLVFSIQEILNSWRWSISVDKK